MRDIKRGGHVRMARRARHDDRLAVAALEATARYLGTGLAALVNAMDPARIYIGGETTTAWDLLEPIVRAALDARTLAPIRGRIDMVIVLHEQLPRLRGAAALITTPAFAVPGLFPATGTDDM